MGKKEFKHKVWFAHSNEPEEWVVTREWIDESRRNEQMLSLAESIARGYVETYLMGLDFEPEFKVNVRILDGATERLYNVDIDVDYTPSLYANGREVNEQKRDKEFFEFLQDNRERMRKIMNGE